MSLTSEIAELGFLVVEDHGFQRWTTAMTLQRLGARRVLSAQDGHSAIALMESLPKPIDIVVTDLDMPGMDGMEFIRRVGESDKRISFIVSSGLDRALVEAVETMANAYGLRLLGTIEKPVTASELEMLISLHGQPGAGALRRDAGAAFSIEEILVGLRADRFEPYFQPQVWVESGAASGVEALARWDHPTRGIVGPEAFMPQIEAANETALLAETILRKAADVCRPWLRTQFDATLAVNLSVTALNDVRLADRLVEAVADLDIEPRNIVFEVTESAAATHLGRALENLLRLRMRGFGLSIDDYGTGYASMQQLTRIAFTELKIDQSFLRNAANHASSRAVLESSLEMARKLGITAVSEGVETRAEWDLLRDLRCPVAQGFFIARPMGRERFLDWIRTATVET
jgi:EAL domain-containing protein (putative c-di-GMP-specific phosphodiesterase class I)